jgi:MFS family permease
VVLPAVGALAVAVLTLKPSASVENETAPVTEDDGRDHDRQPWIDAWLLLTLAILVEFSFAFYASTYLREEVDMGKAGAAAGAAAFGIGMTSGRFLAGAVRSHADRSIVSHLLTVGGGFALMWFVPQPVAAIAGIGIAGFGVSLLYPIGIDRLMRRFPHSVGAGAARGGLASGVALCGAPAILGILRAVSDVRIAYLAVPVLVVATWVTNRWCESREPARATRARATDRR